MTNWKQALDTTKECMEEGCPGKGHLRYEVEKCEYFCIACGARYGYDAYKKALENGTKPKNLATPAPADDTIAPPGETIVARGETQSVGGGSDISGPQVEKGGPMKNTEKDEKPCPLCGKGKEAGKMWGGIHKECRKRRKANAKLLGKQGKTPRAHASSGSQPPVADAPRPSAGVRSKTWIDVQIDELVTKITALAKEQGSRRVKIELEFEISVKDAKVTQL